MEKQWKIAEHSHSPAVSKLQEKLGVDRIVASLLHLRGQTTFETSKLFFRPELSQLHDPFLMKGMRTAIERINTSITKNEKVMIYGDYDVDGTTAVSLVFSFFKEHINLIDHYIPDRYKEGYGISFKGIDYASENGFSLIIALDCGIKANDKIDYANSKNIDFIICDHHLPGDEVPKACAVLDPKQHDCEYPYKELSGCGIGFKLIQAYSIHNKLPLQACYNYLDLVAASIAADIVPITGENRVLAHYGLSIINASPRPGIKALLNLNQIKQVTTITSLVFGLGPRINAAGRIEHARKAVELLICDNDEQAAELALAINDTNTQRKDLDLGTTQEAYSILENDVLVAGKTTTVLFNAKWHKGVIGIVASRLIEKYYRPTIILTESDGKATGSARSVKEYDVYSAIEKCSDLLEQFGGHKFAAGLTLKKENVEAFKIKFEDIVSSTITKDQLIPKIEIDLVIDFHEITEKLVRILKQFAPHGPENMMPLFCARNVFDTGWGRIIGTNHLKLELFQKSNPNIRFQAIAYDKGDYINFFQRKTPMDIVFKVIENEYKGVTSVQLLIEDIKVNTLG
ncbi:MAG: single-stranded-DNA-specific exonuclease RecJ [Bacteroidetes bacterium]|nr:single-stranded-DNA-specific exonuclease RecJ [Bacteroidota bacterium]